MIISALFIARPIGTVLLSIGLAIAGCAAYTALPVAELPDIEFPTIVVSATRPGAGPETMASSIAAPLERRLGEIPGVSRLTSTNADGNTSIVVEFDLRRSVDAAARDVQAAIDAATPDLPRNLPARPSYRKVNLAEAPILTLALTSDSLTTTQITDAVERILIPRISTMSGVDRVSLYGAERPAIRIRFDPLRLAAAGLSPHDVAAAVVASNVLQPLGGFEGPLRAETIGVNGQMVHPADFDALILKAAGDAVLRLSDVATVTVGGATERLGAWIGDRPAVLADVGKRGSANALDTADAVKTSLRGLMSSMPAGIRLEVFADRTLMVRAGFTNFRLTLLATLVLVLAVSLFFIGRIATIVVMITVVLSMCGALAAMWLLGASLDAYSLNALTISMGFIADDAIVMTERVVRFRRAGMEPSAAALAGSAQIGFTVIVISVSLAAVFLPLLFMGGILGELLHEFAMTLTVAVAVSATVSLTATPAICEILMRSLSSLEPARASLGRRLADRATDGAQARYGRMVAWSLRRGRLVVLATLATVPLAVWLHRVVPEGFVPDSDTGMLAGSTFSDADVSFSAMVERQRRVVDVLRADPAVESVASMVGVATGWGARNRGDLRINLKPPATSGLTSEQVVERLRASLGRFGDVETFIHLSRGSGGGGGGSDYDVAVASADIGSMRRWSSALAERLRATPGVADVAVDLSAVAPQVRVEVDRDEAARLGVSMAAIDEGLGDAFSQPRISTVYTQDDQHDVIIEADPAFGRGPAALGAVYVGAGNRTLVPLSALAAVSRVSAPAAIQHEGQFPAATLSFSLPPRTSLGEAVAAVEQAGLELRMPGDVHLQFGGSARYLQETSTSEPLLIGVAILVIYVVLGVLYECWLHPLTIMSTLPSAVAGALLALLATGTELTIVAFVGILLLLGIVKKNAITVVDHARAAEGDGGTPPEAAILAACLERFRPTLMTTFAALLGALPLALATGTGSELRQPLGIAVCGGLILSQTLALITTPAVYAALGRTGRNRRRERFRDDREVIELAASKQA